MTSSWNASGKPARGALTLVLAVLAAAWLFNAAPASAAGVQDFQFTTPSAPGGPTGEKPQSKLWFNDGIWWGSLWNGSGYDIHRYNAATGAWSDTGTRIDTRSRTNQDVLWDGAHLYVLSVVTPSTGVPPIDQAMRLFRYSYSAATKTYSLDAPFKSQVVGQPDGVTVLAAPPGGNGLETAVLTKDSLGTLWIAYTASTDGLKRNVFVTHSTVGDTTWVASYIPPVPNASPRSSASRARSA